ncbi:MAG: ATP-binding protein, partial [Polyangiaceae bacterium]
MRSGFTRGDETMTVGEALARERAYLLALPSHPFEADLLRVVRSDKTPYVHFDRNLYSIPHTLKGMPLTLVASLTTVRLLDRPDHEIARHTRSWGTGQVVEDPRHVEGLVRYKHAARELNGRDRLRVAVAETDRFFDVLALRGDNLGATTSRLLSLLDAYGAEELRAAVVEALGRRPSAPAPWPTSWNSAGAPGASPHRCASSFPTTRAYANCACAPTDWRNTMPSDDTTKTTNKATDLAAALQALGLWRIAEELDDFVARATKARWSVVQILSELGRLEAQERARRSCERRLWRSKLGRFKAMANFDWSWPKKIDRAAVERVMSLGFLERAENVVLVAPQGVGKTM